MTLVLKNYSVDKFEKNDQELSRYSSISTLNDFRTTKHLWQKRKQRRKLQKRHRFPPSLLSSRAVDFWNTLMPLRANCSCSSVSLRDTCSRLSLDFSTSDFIGNDSVSSVPIVEENGDRGNLGDSLKHTHSVFELLLARMVRLLNILNEKSDSSSSHIFSDSNLKTILPPNSKSDENTELISNQSSNDYQKYWAEKKWESSSKLEIAQEKKLYFRRGKGFFSPTILVPKTLRPSKQSVLTNDELVYLLQYKKSLLSEYFQRQVDSIDLKKNLDSCDRKSLICGTQSDSRLQEHSLLQFVQFIRTRKERATETVLEKDFSLSNAQKSDTKFTDLKKEESRLLLTPKRRVTFSDPLSENSTTLLNCCLSDDENRILSAQSFSTTITNISEIPLAKFDQSDDLVDFKSVSPSDSSLSLKACIATLSLNSLCEKTQDINPADSDNCTTKQTAVSPKNIEDEKLVYDDGLNDIEEKSSMEKAETLPVLTPKISYILDDVKNPVKIKGEESLNELKFFGEKTLDVGRTTHGPMLNDSKLITIPTEDDKSLRESNPQNNSKKRFKGKIHSIKTPETCELVDASIYELETESMRTKMTELGNIQQTEISVKCDESFSNEIVDWSRRRSLPSGKTVTFEDCCKIKGYQSIIYNDEKDAEISLQLDQGEQISSSESKGRFELTWKGCWDQLKDDEREPNTEISECSLLSEDDKPPADISMSQTPSCTMMESEIKLSKDNRSEYRSRSLRATFPSSYPHNISNRPSFTAIAASLEEENSEIIPWMMKSKDDFPKHSRPASKFNCNSDSNSRSDAIKLENVCKGIKNPEIWRADVRSDAPFFYKSKKYPWKTSEIETDWLMRRLKELQSNPETDYDSDCCADSEIESDFEWERDSRYDKYRKFETMRNRFRPNLFLNKVLSSRKIIFNECRCSENSRSNNCSRKLKDHDHQQSNQNFFSHLNARLILDSETDDSDLTPSIKTDFSYNSNRKDEHVNKIKCRKFVRSLRSINSEEDRRLSSARLLNVTFEKSFSPASVQSVFSTRTVGTNVSEKQNCHNTMTDVSIDTCDLCTRKPFEATNQDPESSFLNKNSICQTIETTINAPSLLDVTATPEVLIMKKNTDCESELQTSETSEQRFSNALANLSTEINNASNNLVKLRFSEIKTTPVKVTDDVVIKERNPVTVSPLESCQTIIKQKSTVEELREPMRSHTFSNFKNTVEKCSKILNNSSPYAGNPGCPICRTHKEPTKRYVLPSCTVKGVHPDSNTNEKDPWNRVMKQAQAQYRSEGRNTASTSLQEMNSSSKSARLVSPLFQPPSIKSSERNSAQNSATGHRLSSKEENLARIQLVQVKNNSSQATAVYELEGDSFVTKIRSSLPKNKRIELPPTSTADVFSTSSDLSATTMSLPRTRSPRSNRNQKILPNTSNRLLYIISEKSELGQQSLIKSPVVNLFD